MKNKERRCFFYNDYIRFNRINVRTTRVFIGRFGSSFAANTPYAIETKTLKGVETRKNIDASKNVNNIIGRIVRSAAAIGLR